MGSVCSRTEEVTQVIISAEWLRSSCPISNGLSFYFGTPACARQRFMYSVRSLSVCVLQFRLHDDVFKTYSSRVCDADTFTSSFYFGCDNDHTVRSSRTVKCRSSTAFQYRHRGNVFGVKVAKAVTHIRRRVPEVVVGSTGKVSQGHTVHHDKRLVVSGQRVESSQDDF